MFWKRKQKEDYLIFEADDHYAEEYEVKEKGNGQLVKKIYNSRTLTRVAFALLAYIMFVVVGVLSTPFLYNEIGYRTPEVVDIQTRIDRGHYREVRQHYIVIKSLLLRINQLDRQVASGNLDNFYYSTKYGELLTGINENMAKLRGLYVPTRFKTLQRQIEETYNGTAIFLQKMSEALATGNAQTLAEADSWRAQIYGQFEVLQENMFGFSRMVKIDDTELFPKRQE